MVPLATHVRENLYTYLNLEFNFILVINQTLSHDTSNTLHFLGVILFCNLKNDDIFFVWSLKFSSLLGVYFIYSSSAHVISDTSAPVLKSGSWMLPVCPYGLWPERSLAPLVLISLTLIVLVWIACPNLDHMLCV